MQESSDSRFIGAQRVKRFCRCRRQPDAPALMARIVGIAYGPNSDITSGAADAVILTTSLKKVDELVPHQQSHAPDRAPERARGHVGQRSGDDGGGSGTPAGFGRRHLQEFIDLAAVINAVRVALPTKDLADMK